MNLQEKIRLGEESLLDFSHITKFDLSNEGARIALVQHILHYIENADEKTPLLKDDKSHIISEHGKK